MYSFEKNRGICTVKNYLKLGGAQFQQSISKKDGWLIPTLGLPDLLTYNQLLTSYLSWFFYTGICHPQLIQRIKTCIDIFVNSIIVGSKLFNLSFKELFV